jgi:hypothetical protein
MSKVGRSGRSFEAITTADLRRLRDITADYRADFFRRRPDWAALYADRLICAALCQGAALHYCDGVTGINDFDVYNFFATHPSRRWYAKPVTIRDFGDAKFGQSNDRAAFVGRRVDVLGRGLPVQPSEDPTAAVRTYLASGQTETARRLAKKAVVGLDPPHIFGEVLWPLGTRSAP